MKRKIGFILLLYICSYPVIGQMKINEGDLFKMYIFLERPLFDNRDLIKDNSLYQYYCDHMTISPRPLTSTSMRSDFRFYICNIMSDISYDKIASNSDDGKDFGILSGFNHDYILCIDLLIGKSYRIMGFDGNDFLEFLEDYCKRDRVSRREFFRWFSVEGIDFKCLYRALRSKERDRDKYPCLQRVSDPIRIH